MRYIFSVVALAILAATISQLYKLEGKKTALEADLKTVSGRADALVKENVNLASDIEYLHNPKNLEKEARSVLNYAKPGEKLIIVVPKKVP